MVVSDGALSLQSIDGMRAKMSGRIPSKNDLLKLHEEVSKLRYSIQNTSESVVSKRAFPGFIPIDRFYPCL